MSAPVCFNYNCTNPPAAQHVVASRILDVDGQSISSPICGIKDAPLMSLEEAVEFAQDRDVDLRQIPLQGNVVCAEIFAETLDDLDELLSADEIGAIHLYTQQSPWYQILNERLRLRERDPLKPFFPYIKLLLTALYKLPIHHGMLYRGVKLDLCTLFQRGKKKIWWSFSSATNRADVLENAAFLGKSGHRTMFHINAISGVDIQRYSAYSKESEILLLPGTCLVVEAVLNLGAGLHMVQLKEILVDGLIDFPRPTPTTAPATTPTTTTPAPKPAQSADPAVDPLLPQVRDWFLSGWKSVCDFKKIPVSCVQILDVVRLDNPSTQARFETQTKSMAVKNIHWLWHGTADIRCAKATCNRPDCSLCQIRTHGFHPSKARTKGRSYEMFGDACYFGDFAAIAHNYNGQNEDVLGKGVRLIILSQVALGEVGDVDYHHELRVNWRDDTVVLKCFGGDSGIYLKHYMIRNPNLSVPSYAIIYKYPSVFSDRVPWNEGRAEAKYCAFHKMTHGDAHSCDSLCNRTGCQ